MKQKKNLSIYTVKVEENTFAQLYIDMVKCCNI